MNFPLCFFFLLLPLCHPAQFDCSNFPLANDLTISTSLNENNFDYDIKIFDECAVAQNFKVKANSLPSCEVCNRVFEAEENIRRPIRFSLRDSNKKNSKLTIKGISLSFPHDKADTTLTKSSFTLSPGDYVDTYVEYDCLNVNSANWYTLQFDIEVEGAENKIKFEFVKICHMNSNTNFDISQFIVIVIMFAVIYVASMEIFHSKVEKIIVSRYNEMRNPENLIIIGVVLFIIIIMLYIINCLNEWIVLCLFFSVPMSVGMIAEALHKDTNLHKEMNAKIYNVPYIGEVTNDNLLCLLIGFVFFFLWVLTHNWILCDVIAIAVSIIAIRIFKFTNSKILIGISIIGILYDLLWTSKYSMKYDNYKLTNDVSHHFPIRILCPGLSSSPFGICSSLPISDIILPGIFIGYSKKFDEKLKLPLLGINYYNVGIIAIGVGFVLNLFVYYFMMIPTPSFLFTGTLLLVATLAFAYKNDHFLDFIEGFKSTEYGDKLAENVGKIAMNFDETLRKKNNTNISVNDINRKSEKSEQFYLNKEEYEPPNTTTEKKVIELEELKDKIK